MNSEAFAVWSSLFDEGVKNVWLTESKELKCAAMVLHALKRELKKIENTFETKLSNYKEKLLNKNCDKVDIAKTDINQSLVEHSLNNTTQISELDQAITGISNEYLDKTRSASPKITRNKNILKRKKVTPQLTPSVLSFNKRNESTSSIDSDNSLNLLHIETPKKPDNIPDVLDCSLIEATPVVTKKKRKKDTSGNATLTQMFAKEAAGPSVQTEDDNSSMFIDEILDYINMDGDQEPKSNVDTKLVPINNQKSYPIEKRTSLNYLCKPKPVRGKARMNLPGWSCKQCRDFYEALGLSPDELKVKMDECSKHRNEFTPTDDTPPGFWDMTFPPTPSTFHE